MSQQHPNEPDPIVPVPPEPLEEEEVVENGDDEAPEEPEKEGDPDPDAAKTAPGKQAISLELSDRVVDYFQGMGVPDWKDRIDYTLQMFVDMGGIWSGDKPEGGAG